MSTTLFPLSHNSEQSLALLAISYQVPPSLRVPRGPVTSSDSSHMSSPTPSVSLNSFNNFSFNATRLFQRKGVAMETSMCPGKSLTAHWICWKLEAVVLSTPEGLLGKTVYFFSHAQNKQQLYRIYILVSEFWEHNFPTMHADYWQSSWSVGCGGQ